MAEAVTEAPRKSSPGHGGKRRGSGRKPKTEQNDAYTILAKARAKRESHRAQMAEIDYRERLSELYDRGETLTTISEAVALFVDQVRSIPDKLERKSGLTADQAQAAETLINAELAALKKRLMALSDV